MATVVENNLLDLPHPVLCRIFSYLDESADRQHAALACSALYDAYCAPEVWYSVRFNICSNFYLYQNDPQLPVEFRDSKLNEEGSVILQSNIVRYTKLVNQFGGYFRTVELRFLLPSLTTPTFNEETAAFIETLAKKVHRAVDISVNIRVLNKPVAAAYSAEIDSRLFANQRADMRCLLQLADFISKCEGLKSFAFQNWPYTLSNVFSTLAEHKNASNFRKIETISTRLFSHNYEAAASDRWIAPPPSNSASSPDADATLSHGVMYLFRELNRSPSRPVNSLMSTVNDSLVELSIVVDLISDVYANEPTNRRVLPSLQKLTLAVTRHSKPLTGWLTRFLAERDASSIQLRLIFATRLSPEVRASFLDRGLPLTGVAFARYVTVTDADLKTIISNHRDRLEHFVCLSDDTQFGAADLIELCASCVKLTRIQYLAKIHIDTLVALANQKRENWVTFIFRDVSYEPTVGDANRLQFRSENSGSCGSLSNVDRYNYVCSAVSCALRRKWQLVSESS